MGETRWSGQWPGEEPGEGGSTHQTAGPVTTTNTRAGVLTLFGLCSSDFFRIKMSDARQTQHTKYKSFHKNLIRKIKLIYPTGYVLFFVR